MKVNQVEVSAYDKQSPAEIMIWQGSNEIWISTDQLELFIEHLRAVKDQIDRGL